MCILPSGLGFGLSRPPSCISSKEKDTLWTCRQSEEAVIYSYQSYSSTHSSTSLLRQCALRLPTVCEHSAAAHTLLLYLSINTCHPFFHIMTGECVFNVITFYCNYLSRYWLLSQSAVIEKGNQSHVRNRSNWKMCFIQCHCISLCMCVCVCARPAVKY